MQNTIFRTELLPHAPRPDAATAAAALELRRAQAVVEDLC